MFPQGTNGFKVISLNHIGIRAFTLRYLFRHYGTFCVRFLPQGWLCGNTTCRSRTYTSGVKVRCTAVMLRRYMSATATPTSDFEKFYFLFYLLRYLSIAQAGFEACIRWFLIHLIDTHSKDGLLFIRWKLIHCANLIGDCF